ncbi:TetR/AcrR family transcriptional regulator [Mycolicibacterium austroafricanum]|uniref:TetR/AcrR family transcriptional regulator n=1 Tax=Mycolicibacterium austroafricanum TaxID=39687 RepID=UPI001CA325EF|nr:TetR/AcrR family transcriptional regulator [Mycolicibacterium austroafricanum]QZT61717.1 TetR/AcrR family transcriptional regulator [Mycolicibacterium austroafricanum]
MSSSAKVIYLRSYGDRDREDHHVVGAVLDATAALLCEFTFDDLTTRRIAEAAGVTHGDLRVYFRSTEAIVAEIYLGLLRDAPLTVDIEQSAQRRVAALFYQLVMLPADHPGLAAACSRALISQKMSAHAIRRRIHAELHRRVCAVLRSEAWPEVTETLEFGLVGAMVQASSGITTFEASADELARVVARLLPAGS